MTAPEYKAWWQLHLRVARGEPLSVQEQAAYQAGLARLDREEETQLQSDDLAALRALRTQIDEGTELHARYLAQTAQLDEQIAVLEQAYQQLTGYDLAAEPHAPS